MLTVALDACALVHAKGLPPAGSGVVSGLDLLQSLADFGAGYITTRGVSAELVTMSLQATLESWQEENLLDVTFAPSKDVRSLQNQIAKKVPRPGRNDVALICVARSTDSVLLTHDTGAAGFARAAKVVTMDLLDVGSFLIQRGKLTAATVEAVLSPFNNPGAFRPADWLGSAQSTLLARPHLEDLHADLQRRLEAGA